MDELNTGAQRLHTKHSMKHRRRPRSKPMPIANSFSILKRLPETNGKQFGDCGDCGDWLTELIMN